MSRKSKKISRLQKDNRFLKYVVERAKKQYESDQIEIERLKNLKCN